MSPWVFYVIDIVHSLRIVMIITTFLSILCLFFVLSCDNTERESPMPSKWEFLLFF